MDTSAAENIIRDVKKRVADCYADGHLDAGEILKIAVGVFSKVTHVQGEEKKAFVLNAIEAGLKEVFPGELYEQGVSKSVRAVLPAALDIALDEMAVAASWMSLCCGCLPPKAQKPCLSSAVPAAAAAPAAVAAVVPVHVAVVPALSVAAAEPVAAAAEPVAAQVAPDADPVA